MHLKKHRRRNAQRRGIGKYEGIIALAMILAPMGAASAATLLQSSTIFPAPYGSPLPAPAGPGGGAGGLPSGESPGYLLNFTNFGKPAGRDLAARGIYLHGSLQQAEASVVSGGHKQGSDYMGIGFWGFDIDTGKAFGIPGGTIDFTISTQVGNTLSSANAGASKTFNNWGFGNGVRLVNLYYDQSLMNGVLHIAAGRMNPLTSSPFTSPYELSPGFHMMPWYCSFFTMSCGNTYAFNLNASKPGYTVGTWGSFITYHPAPFWYVKAGIFESEPVETTTYNNGGWPGADWGLNESHGAYVPVEVGYITTPANSLYPSNIQIGGDVDTTEYADKYYNAKMRPIAEFGGAPLYHDRTSGIFAGIQQTVLRFSDDPRSTRGVAIFASGDWDVSGLETVQQEYMGGLIVTGPFPSRAADTLNLLFDYQVFDSRLKADRQLIAALHGRNYTMRNETGFEINYAFAVAPGLSVSPYTQFVANPDQMGLSIPEPHDTYAFSVGVRAVIKFETLLGLPTLRQ